MNKIFIIDHEIYSRWSSENTLDPRKIIIGSHKIALWVCDNEHTFKSAVRNQVKGTECSYCSGKKKISGINDLKALYPDIHAELSSNNKSDLTEIAPNSNKCLLWICSKGHEYLSPPNRRTSGSGCAYCSNNKILQGFNDLATTNPELLKDWDFSKNTKNPQEVFAKGASKYWWVCNDDHSYKMTGGKKIDGRGCTYCNKGTLLIGFNDLSSKFPDIADEWNYTKNVISPHNVTVGSSLKVWWECKQRHTWLASIYNRTKKNSGCPDCSKRVSKGELEVREFLEEFLKKSAIANSRKIIAPLELDIYFPDESFAIEFNGTFWHSEAQIQSTRDISAKEYHQSKIDLCKAKSIDLVFVWQDDWVENMETVKNALQHFINDRQTKPEILNKLDREETL